MAAWWRIVAGVVILAGAICAGVALKGCDDTAAAGVELVQIEGKKFFLEVAADNDSRTLGLGGREYIADDGGMLFLFPEPARRNFVMRDCPIAIDVIFLDQLGNVTAIHAMPAEEPQGEDESDYDYEMRLKRFPSRMAAQYAIELQGGKASELGVEPGDSIKLDFARLKAMAR